MKQILIVMDVGQSIGHIAASAGLCQRQAGPGFRSQPDDHLFQCVVVATEDVCAEAGTNHGFGARNEVTTFGAAGNEAHIHFAGPRAIADLKTLLQQGRQFRVELFFDPRLTDAAGSKGEAMEGLG